MCIYVYTCISVYVYVYVYVCVYIYTHIVIISARSLKSLNKASESIIIYYNITTSYNIMLDDMNQYHIIKFIICDT